MIAYAVFAFASGVSVLASMGVAAPPHRMPPGTPLFHSVVLGDDVTVTQAATVRELHRADQSADVRVLIERAMNVGRSHIAATINTVILAYVGASLPLLGLFAAGGHDPLLVASSEVVAVEIVRSLVGSIGIVAAVPLTTVIAAYLVRGPSDDRRA